MKKIKDKYLDLIYKVFKESHQTYGHRRITLALRQEHNVIVNKKKVARIMKENIIVPEYHKKKPKATRTMIDKFKKPNLVNRHFSPQKPNQVWVTDVCELKFKSVKKQYLSVMLDLFDRKIVAYKIGDNNDAELATATLITAKWNRLEAENVIIHSDQGSSYFSFEFQNQCEKFGFQQSMSRAGKPIDNSVIESFFSRYRAEIKGFPKPKSAEEQKLIVFDWIWFYMNKRISLPKKITKRKVFNYDKAIEKAKEFEKLKLKKIKLN